MIHHFVTNRYVLILLILLIAVNKANAQGEIADQPAIFYRNEISPGLSLFSNGAGASFRYGKRLNARKKRIYEVGIAGIKHPKEVRISNPYYNNKGFVFGKLNSFFTLNGGIGAQKELYKKSDKGGISIRRFHSFGPSIGLLKPVYYEVFHAGGSGPGDYYLETEKFDPSTHQGNIYGKASFFKGFKEISLTPGGYFRFGFSFEYSREDIVLHALEAGFQVEAFLKEPDIMSIEKNNHVFLSLFVSYRFGKIIDARGNITVDDLINP